MRSDFQATAHRREAAWGKTFMREVLATGMEITIRHSGDDATDYHLGVAIAKIALY